MTLTRATNDSKAKPVPVRRCAACGERDTKGSLLRIVRAPLAAEGDAVDAKSEEGGPETGERGGDYRVAVDARGKANGRGAYLCRKAACLDAGIRKGRIEHTLKVRLSPGDKARLLAEVGVVMGLRQSAAQPMAPNAGKSGPVATNIESHLLH